MFFCISCEEIRVCENESHRRKNPVAERLSDLFFLFVDTIFLVLTRKTFIFR